MKSNVFVLCTFLLLLFLSSCQKELHFETEAPIQIKLINPGFEQGLSGWTVETGYTGQFGFSSSKDAIRTGAFGLNFYAAQTHHFYGAPQETPWNGKIYQEVAGLKDGLYSFKAFADAVGDGMYLWAYSGGKEQKAKIKSDRNEVNTLEFMVTDGSAKIGFICINAEGRDSFAPYFHADDVELWKK